MAKQHWMRQLEGGLGAFAVRFHRRPVRALIFAALLTVIGGLLAARLTLNANLVDLLPSTFQSVQNIKKLEQRFGGIGWVTVVAEGSEPAELKRFARDIAPALEKLDGVRFVDYERPTQFFAERALYYLDIEDLNEAYRRLKAREQYEKNANNPLYVNLEDPADAPSLDFSDLEKKYQRNSSNRLAGAGESFYLDPVAQRIVILVKPKGNSANLAFSKRIVRQVNDLLTQVDTKRYGPNFRVELTGTFKKKIDQQQQIAHDIKTSSSVALVILLIYLAWHFRSLMAVLLSLLPVGAGLAWTYGGVGLGYGQLSLLTGFLGAILGGLGVEHGIHLLTRYLALRAEGVSSEDATRESFTHTGGSALISALVAALTFFSLAVSEFRAFREFGIISGAGMFVMVAAYVLVLPAALGLAHRLGWRPRLPATSQHSNHPIARTILRLRRPLTLGVGVLVLVLAVEGRRVTFDFDFASLEDQHLPSFIRDKQVNALLGHSQTPVAVLTDRLEQEGAVVAELERRKQALGDHSTIDFVGSLDDLVPQDQLAKQTTMAHMAEVLANVDRDALDETVRTQFDDLQQKLTAQPFTRADLPTSLRRQFQGDGQNLNGFVLVFPRISLSNGDRVRDLAKELSSITLPDGAQLTAAGEPMVLADILNTVTHEGPLILGLAVLTVLCAMWGTLGCLRDALLCILPTAVSLLALVGIMPILGVRFNYLNILVLPMLLGTTVDAGVHLLGRLGTIAGTQNFVPVFAETGRAIAGGLFTSVVGFSALLLADHPGLNSIGRLANLGFASNFVVMLVAFPAVLVLIAERRARQTPTDTPHSDEPIP